MPRRRRATRKTALQVRADERATVVAKALGRSLREARRRHRLSQTALGDLAGIGQSTVSQMELGQKPNLSMVTWSRAATVVGADLHAYFQGATGADEPRDAVHLRAQELIVRTAAAGRWKGRPEAAMDDPARGSRSIDVLLERERPDERKELAVFEVWDWQDDVGAAFRAWDRRLAWAEQSAIARMIGDATVPRVSGCWVLRATKRNRALVTAHRMLFRARFPGSGAAWLDSLRDPNEPMPPAPALLWISVTGDRLWPARW